MGRCVSSAANCLGTLPNLYEETHRFLSPERHEGPILCLPCPGSFFGPQERWFYRVLTLSKKKRDKDKLWQDPEINPGEADIVSLNVIESPWCLVGGGGWGTDLLTFKSVGWGGGWREGMGGGALLLQAKQAAP